MAVEQEGEAGEVARLRSGQDIDLRVLRNWGSGVLKWAVVAVQRVDTKITVIGHH